MDVFLKPDSFTNRNYSTDVKDSIISERLDHVVRSTLSLFNVSRYGVDLALAEELRDLSDFQEAEKKAKEVNLKGEYFCISLMRDVTYPQAIEIARSPTTSTWPKQRVCWGRYSSPRESSKKPP